ncbi:HIT-like protein [Athelia psychrophila]|uniref:HIT-like protein n=1 Tax=Athelia psychrophila TaxID=1759441 RepID=A0A166L6N4_9AGAM|nr:HIT-like protein [Fibularhizoctonia sp. CBS 109695]
MVSWWSFSCWNSRKPIQLELEDGLTASDKLVPESCAFCNVSKEKGFNVVWEDDSFVAFEDIRPASMYHLQIVPREHIDSVKALGKTDVELVKRMADIAHHILDERNVPMNRRKIGFHIPPYYSVAHLHMHVQGLPYVSITKVLKYPVVGGFGKYQKGFSWFAEAGQTMRILERGGAVKISPS